MPLRRFEEALDRRRRAARRQLPVAVRPRGLPASRTSRPRAAAPRRRSTTRTCTCRSPSTPRPRRSGWSTGCCLRSAIACCASPRPRRASRSTRPRSWRSCRSAPARDAPPRGARLRLGRRHARPRGGGLRRGGRGGSPITGSSRPSASRPSTASSASRRTGRRSSTRRTSTPSSSARRTRCTPGSPSPRSRRASTCSARSRWRRPSPTARRCSRPPPGCDRLLLVLHPWRHHEAVIATPRRDRSRRARPRRAHARLRRARRLGPGRLVHRSGAGRRRSARRHGHPRHRHRALPARRPAGAARARLDHDGARRLRRRRRRPRADRVGGRRALGRGVGLVAAAPRRPRGRHRGLRQLRLPAHLGARAAAGLRPLRGDALHRAAARCRSRQIAAWQPGTPSPAHGLAALRICEQAYESAGVRSAHAS